MPSRLLLPLSRLYLAELARRNRAFDRGRGVRTLPIPVLSVGNLSVGGTGKTPTVRTLCAWLRDAGHTPAIAMRGYKPGPQGSDEALEYRRLLPDTPVIVRPDRYEAITEFLATSAHGSATYSIDCVVLDDGFQHRRLSRVFDLVLIDASRWPYDDAPLPAGRLRELPSSLVRAQAVLITHAELVTQNQIAQLESRLGREHPHLTIAVGEHAWSGVQVREGGSPPVRHSLDWLRDKRIVAACGLGNPAGFFAAAERVLGHQPVETIVLPDHAAFGAAQRARLAAAVRRHQAECVLISLKDDVKIAKPADLGVPVAAALLDLRFWTGEAELRSRVLSAVGS
ncbi:MAG: tetraacyldisaccharide 4'-kinase [Phycisphaerales bacterium]|nr:tetraacyldisaccharide 4'-kinase [Phycisphaerales bacterium]